MPRYLRRHEGPLTARTKLEKDVGIPREEEQESVDRAFEELDRYVTLAIVTGEWGPCHDYMPKLKAAIDDLSQRTRNFKQFAAHIQNNIRIILGTVEVPRDFDHSLKQDLKLWSKKFTRH